MEKVVQDIFGRPMTFGPLIVITAIIIIATGLLIYRLTEKKSREPEGPKYIFIEGLGWIRDDTTDAKGNKINVRKLCREFQREGFCERLSNQPEDDSNGSGEEAEAEDQERTVLPEENTGSAGAEVS